MRKAVKYLDIRTKCRFKNKFPLKKLNSLNSLRFSLPHNAPTNNAFVRPRRAAAVRTNAAIDASLRAEAQTTRLGKIKKTG